MHMREKRKVKSMLNVSLGRIYLTSDLWTSLIIDGYMCLTIHFIDKDISFMPLPHNSISLFEKIYILLQEVGIQNNIFTITLDNASSNDACFEGLKQILDIKKALLCESEFFYLRSCAHIRNLIVRDGLNEINDAIQKIQDSVKYVRGSQGRIKFSLGYESNVIGQ